MTLPLVAFTRVPVMVRALSEARKAATCAVSATVGRLLRSVACSNLDTICAFETPSVFTALSIPCWIVLLSTIGPE